MPIAEVADYTDDVAEPTIAGKNPLELLKSENARLHTRLQFMENYVSELEEKADMDPLIPIYNRRAFIRELSRAQGMHKRYELVSSIIYFDVNDFKSVNDRYGHMVGDKLLLGVGMVLKSSCRDFDIVARLGGDEFGMLMLKTDVETARLRAKEIADQISHIQMHEGPPDVRVSVAWGVSRCDSPKGPEMALARADKNMYERKVNHKASGLIT